MPHNVCWGVKFSQIAIFAWRSIQFVSFGSDSTVLSIIDRMDKRREPEPTFFESPIWKAMFPFNWQRMWSGIVPSTLAGGVGGFLYATGTGRAIVLTPAAWSLYAAASSTAFFGLREWMFAPEGLDSLENEPVWKQLAVRKNCVLTFFLFPGVINSILLMLDIAISWNCAWCGGRTRFEAWNKGGFHWRSRCWSGYNCYSYWYHRISYVCTDFVGELGHQRCGHKQRQTTSEGSEHACTDRFNGNTTAK
jgi:hypothetical protein